MGKAPDFFYCKSLLEETGVITVPGSGFKQARALAAGAALLLWCRQALLAAAHLTGRAVLGALFCSQLCSSPCSLWRTDVPEPSLCSGAAG